MRKRLILFLACLFTGVGLIVAQTITVTGTITSEEDNEPIIGATILVKGTNMGTVSDVNGKFSISNVPGTAKILQISYIGMRTQEVTIKPTLTILMKSDSEILDEVVITGMTATDKRLFTGATDRINAEGSILSGIADISRSLEGRSAGVSVQNVSGTFGTAPKIQVRGATSIYGNSKPLWVVDGVIIEDATDISADQLSSGDAVTLIGNAISGLNADDIETFDILKDGSATSIYGARAMAGVIVITTKRGKAGSARINYTGDFSIRMIPSYRNFNIMNSQDQMGVYQELERKGWLNYADVYRGQESGIYGQMYRLIHQYDATSGQFGLPNTTEARNAYLRQAEMRNTDWFDELFSNSLMQTHSISISQGTEKSNSYISASVMNDPGWNKRSSVERYTLNANAQYKILNNLSISLLGSGSYRKQEAPGTVAQNTDAVSGRISRDFDINPYSYALNTSRTMGPNDTFIRNYTTFNIMDELDQNYLEYDIAEVKFQGELKWKPIKTLELAALGAVKYSSTSMQHHIKDGSNYARAYREMSDAIIIENNPWLYDDPEKTNTLPITILPVGGFYEKREYKMKNYDFRATATFNQMFNDIHSLSAYGGMEVNVVERTSDWFRGIGMQYENGERPYFNYLAFKKLREGNTDYFSLDNTIGKSVAFFGTSTYSYKGKYSLTGTLRYEGSNRLGKSRKARWLPTWNMSAAWNVHEEDFFEAFEPTLSHLKLRTSYSLTADTGPADVSNSQVIINSYNPWRPGANDSQTGLQIVASENSELTYEKKNEFNFGIDAGLLDNRLNLVIDFYSRKMYDQIGYVATQNGYKKANAAEFKSHGIEFTISSRNIDTKDFRWSTDLTFSYNKNKITDLKTQDFLMNFVNGLGFAKTGYPLGSLFSIPFLGLDNEGLPMFQFQDEVITAKNYKNLNFQERDDLDFLKYEGTITPPYTGGFGNIFTYKNFRLNIFMTYAFGNKLRLNPVFKEKYSDMAAIPKDFKNRWMMPGDEEYTNVPTIASARQVRQYGSNNLKRGYNAYNYSSERVADGGFIRMKEISLTYDFPKQMIQNLKMNTLSLKAMVTNPFLIYASKELNGQDPEFFQSGGVAVPMAQQFTLNVRVGF